MNVNGSHVEGIDSKGVIAISAANREIGVDDRLRVADHVYAVGDCIGHELSTHLGHYEGETLVIEYFAAGMFRQRNTIGWSARVVLVL